MTELLFGVKMWTSTWVKAKDESQTRALLEHHARKPTLAPFLTEPQF